MPNFVEVDPGLMASTRLLSSVKLHLSSVIEFTLPPTPLGWGQRHPEVYFAVFMSPPGPNIHKNRRLRLPPLANPCYTLCNRRIRSEVLACSGYRLLANFHIAFAVNQ
jgi:hypothetical protein